MNILTSPRLTKQFRLILLPFFHNFLLNFEQNLVSQQTMFDQRAHFFPGDKEILNQTQQFCEDISISIYIVKYIVYFVKTYKEKNKN